MAAPYSANVHLINDEEAFESKFKTAKSQGSKKVVVVFSASWCGPCRQVKPVWVKTASEHPEIAFLLVDFSECPGIADELGVKGIPAFISFKEEEQVGTHSGGLVDKLQAFLAEIVAK